MRLASAMVKMRRASPVERSGARIAANRWYAHASMRVDNLHVRRKSFSRNVHECMNTIGKRRFRRKKYAINFACDVMRTADAQTLKTRSLRMSGQSFAAAERINAAVAA
jgi:hypothetical protein